MLWEEMEKYTKLTGEDATHVPIMKIGSYLDGYNKGTEVLDKIRAEIDGIEISGQTDEHTSFIRSGNEVKNIALNIIDKYKTESEVEGEK